jgi:hypothetical protein
VSRRIRDMETPEQQYGRQQAGPGANHTAAAVQPPLTLTDILTNRDGAAEPAEQFVAFLPEHWDIHMVIGHVTEEEFNRRLAAIDHTLSGLQTVRGDFTQRWAVFERHEQECESLYPFIIAMDGDPNDMCRCRADSRAEWVVRWVDAGTVGAIAVTTASADQAGIDAYGTRVLPIGGAR